MAEVVLHVGGIDRFFEDAKAAARALDRGDREPTPSQIAFESMEVLLKTLTPNRWTLLRRLHALGAASVRGLAQALKRDYRGVHGDVMTLLAVGLIERRADGRIMVPWDRITAEMSLDIAA